MNDLPTVAKAIINILLYILYVVFFSFVFSFVFPLLMKLFGAELLSQGDPIFDKIQIFIAILVLLVSLIFRKHFYITGKKQDKKVVEVETYTAKKKQVKNKSETKKAKKSVKNTDSDENEEIKIYVEKEIK